MKKDVQESQNKKDYDLNIIENKCLSKYFKTSAKVCRAEAWTFVCRELSSKLKNTKHIMKLIFTSNNYVLCLIAEMVSLMCLSP